MKISLVGAGRVARHLGKALQTEHEIVQIFSRNIDRAKTLAKQLNAEAISTIDQLNAEVDLVVIAVSDQSISQVIQTIAPIFSQSLIVHTSGSTDINILSDHYPRSGVFYPLQTFSLDRDIDWKSTPLFVEACQTEDVKLLSNLAQSLSDRVYGYRSKQRQTLHLAAVFACNFSNYCYDIAKQIMDAEQVDFSLLYPLMLETADKATQYEPKSMQTGPAMRRDENILQLHETLLTQMQRQDLKEIYQLMSEQLMQRHHLKT